MKTLDLEKLNLAYGAHKDRTNGLCVMEAAAWLAGEKHSDRPECACPAITDFMQRWNDGLPSDAERNRLLKPLLPLVVGTRGSKALETKRRWMAFDWLVREHAPAWMDLTPSLAPHAAALRGLGEIVDDGSLRRGMPVLEEARKALAAAWDAAWAAASAAARAAAWDAASDAAWTAAWGTLAPTQARLQESAQALVRRMCEAKP